MPEFLLKPFVMPLFGVIALLSLAGNAYQAIAHHFEVEGLNGQIKTLTVERDRLLVDNRTLKTNQQTLQAGIATQNAAVDGLKSAAELSAANARAAQSGFNAAAAALDAQAVAISKTPKPPTNVSRAEAASTLIRDTLAGEKAK